MSDPDWICPVCDGGPGNSSVCGCPQSGPYNPARSAWGYRMRMHAEVALIYQFGKLQRDRMRWAYRNRRRLRRAERYERFYLILDIETLPFIGYRSHAIIQR